LHIGLGIGIGIGIVTAAGALKSFSTALAAEITRAQTDSVQHTRPQAPVSQALSNLRQRRESHYGHPIIDFLLSHNLKQSEM
jgi:hypothetical protein